MHCGHGCPASPTLAAINALVTPSAVGFASVQRQRLRDPAPGQAIPGSSMSPKSSAIIAGRTAVWVAMWRTPSMRNCCVVLLRLLHVPKMRASPG